MTATIDDIKAELKSITQAIESTRRQLDALLQKRDKLRSQLSTIERRQALVGRVGISEGVVLCHRCEHEHLRGHKATLIKVNRRRAIVKVGGEQWNIPFDLIHTDEIACKITASMNQDFSVA